MRSLFPSQPQPQQQQQHRSAAPLTAMRFNASWIAAIQSIARSAAPPVTHSASLIDGGSVAAAASAPHVLISEKIPKNLHLPRQASQSPEPRRAAVFIPLCNRHGEASVLFTVRSSKVGTHKGHVSFPGGHIDEGESAVDAAIREMYEELGEKIGALRTLAVCQTVPAVTGTLVTPIIGFMESDVMDFEMFEPHADEVDSVFTRSVAQLTSTDYKSYEMLSPGRSRARGGLLQMPVFGAEAGRERIWGMTAFILDAVLTRCVLPTAQYATSSNPRSSDEDSRHFNSKL